MRYQIMFAPRALEDRKRLTARNRAEVDEAIVRHLRHDPAHISKTRIKRLRGLASPQYRLRVGEVRVFYDVVEDEVHILAIVAKRDAAAWLAIFGKRP